MTGVINVFVGIDVGKSEHWDPTLSRGQGPPK